MKSSAQYEELFEDLMEYTNFTSSEQIKTREDLFEFFSQVKGHSAKNDREFRISKKLFAAVGDAVIKVKAPIERRIKRLVESRKVYTSFKSAKAHEATARTKDGKEVYKSIIVVFRDDKGRIIKDKKIKASLKELRVKEPDRFEVIRK